VTVMNERGAPTPVAWTRLRAPESLMGPADPAAMDATVKASPLFAKYAQTLDRESALEMLTKKVEAGAEAAEKETAEAEAKGETVPYPKKPSTKAPKKADSLIVDVVNSRAGREILRTAAREIVRGVFGIGRRR
jgi:hypothetical protein